MRSIDHADSNIQQYMKQRSCKKGKYCVSIKQIQMH